MALEIAWAKELSYILGNSLYGAATVISAFMAGLALGSFLAGRAFFENRNPLGLYALAQGGIAVKRVCSNCEHYRGDKLPQKYLSGWDSWHCTEIALDVGIDGDATAQLTIDDPDTFSCPKFTAQGGGEGESGG